MSAPGPLMIDLAGTELDAEDREILAHPLVGSVILFSRNYADPQQLAALTAQIRSLRRELLIAVDYEGGRVQRFAEGFTRLPPMRSLGRYYDRDASVACEAARAVGWTIAMELGAADIDLPLTPVLDLDCGVSTVIGDRALHSEAAPVIALARSLREGLNAAGMSATGKHFPGHGAVSADSHHELPVDDRAEADMRADLAPYAALISEGLESVMMAHIRYPQVDEAPASLSAPWIEQRLRHNLRFTGVVFCDDLSMGGAAAAGDYPERARQALAAGCDILPVCNNRAAAIALLDSLAVATAGDEAARQRRAKLRRRGPPPGTPIRTDPRWSRAQAAIANLNRLETEES